MKPLFDSWGAYNYTSFIGSSGTWTLHGTEINEKNTHIKYNQDSEIPKGILRVIDTFKRKQDGLFKPFQRWEVMEQFDLGNIKPIETSEVKLNTETKKKMTRNV